MIETASLHEIKLDLKDLESKQLVDLCVRLAKYKKENKELLNYLLFHASNESSFIGAVKEEAEELFRSLPGGNVYYIKKSLRKILRFVNKQVRFSGIAETEIDLRIFFCLKILEHAIPISKGTVLGNLYDQQLKKIESVFKKLPEDLQADYERDYSRITRR